MLVIFNNLGLLMALIATITSLLAAFLSPDDFHGPGPLTLGLAFISLDLAYRLIYGQRKLIHHRHGGQLFFIPIWIWGLLCLSTGARMLNETLQERHQNQLHRQRLLHSRFN